MGIKKSKEFGNIVKREREALGMTQQELAVALGYSADDAGHCIYMIEKGERGLSGEKVERLKEIFQCDDDYLLGQSEYKNVFEEAAGDMFMLQSSMQRNENFLLSFVEQFLGWELIAKIGIVHSYITGTDSSPFIIKNDSDIPKMSRSDIFRCQYLIFLEDDCQHVVNYREFSRLAKMMPQHIETDLRSISDDPMPYSNRDVASDILTGFNYADGNTIMFKTPEEAVRYYRGHNTDYENDLPDSESADHKS